ncbi:tetratricopeptide repeat protein [Kistimonas asteriae]|uniref:tetratricopeptide repeat protein n=1 Tax=Kistimonas asteriae TaxID=517724 RepID=UPI001BABB6EC|nr:hypothetical protein [Kistimonas asteriae]
MTLHWLRPLLVLFLLLSGGCSLQPSLIPLQAIWSANPSMLIRLEQETAVGRPAAVSSLLESSRQQWLGGNPDNGLVILHRALRISPDDPLVYYYMAMMQSALGEFHEASQLARRSLTLTDAPLMREQVRLFLDQLNRSTGPDIQGKQTRV